MIAFFDDKVPAHSNPLHIVVNSYKSYRRIFIGTYIDQNRVSSTYNHQLEALEDKLSQLMKYRTSLIKELKKQRSHRRNLGDEIRSISDKFVGKKAGLDEYRNQIRNLSEIQKEARIKTKQIQETMRQANFQLRKFKIGTQKEHGVTIRRKIREIEWKIQAERLSREEEKELVKYVKSLEIELRRLRTAYDTRQGLTVLQQEISGLEESVDEILGIKGSIFPEMDEHRKELNELFKIRRQLREEVNSVRKDIGELEANLMSTDQEIHALQVIMSNMVDAVRVKEVEKIRVKESQLLKQAKRSAKAKLSEGRKLSFDELKLVFQDQAGEA